MLIILFVTGNHPSVCVCEAADEPDSRHLHAPLCLHCLSSGCKEACCCFFKVASLCFVFSSNICFVFFFFMMTQMFIFLFIYLFETVVAVLSCYWCSSVSLNAASLCILLSVPAGYKEQTHSFCSLHCCHCRSTEPGEE